MIMFYKNSFILFTILVITTSSCSAQDTAAERDGSAVVSMQMSEADFIPREQEWRDTMAWHASRHCKKGKDNCWATDKQIRYHDVIIVQRVETSGNLEVTFYVRDRYDHEEAGMSDQQVRSFFLKYETDVENDFFVSSPGDIEMGLVSPGEAGMEGWLIAVIVISCVVGLALIITVAVLASRQVKYKKELDTQKTLSEYRIQSGYLAPDGKINPGYDSDNDKRLSGSEGENGQGPPSYFNGVIKPGDSRPSSQYVVFHEKALGDGVSVSEKDRDSDSDKDGPDASVYNSINL